MIVARNDSGLAEITPFHGAEPVDAEAKMLHFLVTVVELSSETCHGASSDSNSRHTILYRSEIDNHGAEISPLCHFSAGSRRTAARAHTHVFW